MMGTLNPTHSLTYYVVQTLRKQGYAPFGVSRCGNDRKTAFQRLWTTPTVDTNYHRRATVR